MIGLNVRQILTALGKFSPSIFAITVTSYLPAPVLAERLITDSSQRFSPSSFVREALRHHGYPNPIKEYHVDTLAGELAISPLDGSVRGLCSRVRLLDGTEAHLPLLDFQCDVNGENAAAILDAMKLMGQTRGALVTSGKSYHYYGIDPMPFEEWRLFMTYSILLAPLIDVRYLAHCLLENMACLRIDARPNQHIEPVVVAVIE